MYVFIYVLKTIFTTRTPSDLMCVRSDRNSEGPGETEVCQFDVACLVNEEVLWLDVTVEDAVSVAVGDAQQ